MRIGIDARMADWSGIGSYTRNFLKALRKIDDENKYILFCNGESSSLLPEAPNFIKREVNVPVFSVAGQFGWRKILASAELDLFYTPYTIVPQRYPCPVVGTVHDLIPWRMPQVQRSKFARVFYRSLIKRSVRQTNRIIVDSNFARDDLIGFLKVPQGRIRVVPAAAEEIYRPIRDKIRLESVREKYGLGYPFLLNVGTARPHKNLPFLVEAFRELRRKGISCQLVLAGGDDIWRPRLRHLVEKLELSGDVIFTGYVGEEDLLLLYNAASACVFPSLFEGFGLPALEAMSCGTPVICSNTSSLAEIVNGAGMLLDLDDLREWIEAMELILSDQELRAKLSEQGLKRAKLFSWEKTARQICEVYEELSKEQSATSCQGPASRG